MKKYLQCGQNAVRPTFVFFFWLIKRHVEHRDRDERRAFSRCECLCVD